MSSPAEYTRLKTRPPRQSWSSCFMVISFCITSSRGRPCWGIGVWGNVSHGPFLPHPDGTMRYELQMMAWGSV